MTKDATKNPLTFNVKYGGEEATISFSIKNEDALKQDKKRVEDYAQLFSEQEKTEEVTNIFEFRHYLPGLDVVVDTDKKEIHVKTTDRFYKTYTFKYTSLVMGNNQFVSKKVKNNKDFHIIGDEEDNFQQVSHFFVAIDRNPNFEKDSLLFIGTSLTRKKPLFVVYTMQFMKNFEISPKKFDFTIELGVVFFGGEKLYFLSRGTRLTPDFKLNIHDRKQITYILNLTDYWNNEEGTAKLKREIVFFYDGDYIF